MWFQKNIQLSGRKRGFHLVTDEIEQQIPELASLTVGIVHLFLQHTSASLTINENADATVRIDMEAHFNRYVPENAPYYQHTYEGEDDMPAHIKTALIGHSLTIPIRQGTFALGMWQGIYLGEHRNDAGGRNIVVTIQRE
ncbi:secondary thiamine-phosphate synthase enzyme YjbQ [Vibrio sp. ZSDE26]|uniref:Secondary thiamine-phosphate synthase enzyme YjbQ n=1 Tax=Vibrio amylolyticus TaxID=2847292 RepID=A0A9X1XTA8_9VIBR|nr:secondary thiamine-phosphate synthase enzyme YjbQ [Vibrio amylolyticus]MCK6265209.1 secondary thiamine-phosphate synthase enzyme YjbQ [Vibrio amylolyticus]